MDDANIDDASAKDAGVSASATMIELTLAQRLHHPCGWLDLQLEATVAAGELIALFGPSGAGKTTILRMLAGLSKPQAGSIVVDGEVWFDSASGIDLPPQRRCVGLVFQDYALFPNLSVRENVAYATTPTERAWVDELLEMMQLSALQHRSPIMLSGGQKQRVALARAVARKPQLLLLDEPLAALDTALRLTLQDELATLHRRLQLRTIIVSHDLGEVFRLADHVWRLEDGRIVQSGSPAVVFCPPHSPGKLLLHAQVLGVDLAHAQSTASLLIGRDIVKVAADQQQAKSLRIGDVVMVTGDASGALRFCVEGDQAC